MTGTLAIVLIIVVWLFVLAPLLLRGQKPIRKAGEAFDEPRVIHEGGSGELRSRRRPRVTPADVRTSREEGNEDYELIDDDDVLIDDRTEDDADRRSGLGGVFGRASARFRSRDEAEPAPAADQVVDGDLIHELESAPAESEAALTAPAAVEPDEAPERRDLGLVYVEDVDGDDGEDEQYYRYSAAYTSPADLMDERAAIDWADATEPATDEIEEVAEPGSTAVRRGRDQGPDLTDEELEFAQRRRGRGGWDPEADQNQSTTRYQRRQRTLLSLAAGVVVTVIAAVIFGGWGWLLPVVAVAAAATYLVALRSQVREEQALRARRIRQLRRSRLGVRQAPEGERSVPRQLRRPGAVVLEVDDESPDFEHLETTRFDLPVYRDGDRVNEPINLNDRRVS